MENLVVHSDLLGLLKSRTQLPQLLKVLTRNANPTSSIFVPTYTQSPSQDPWHWDVPSHGTGAFSEYVRSLPGSVRSANPMNSHSGFGPSASVLGKSDPLKPLGYRSDFDYFDKHNFTLLLIGTTFSRGCTFLHHVEALAQVPYREIVIIPRLIRENGGVKQVELEYFGRVSPNISSDFDRIVPELRRLGALTETRLFNGSFLFLVNLQILREVAIGLLRADPNFFLLNQEWD